MKVSIVVCHHKGRLIIKALASLKAQVGIISEIIVMTSDPKANFWGTKTVYVQGGPAYKRNIAIRYCSHDLIAFFDDDIEAHHMAVYEMAKFLKNNESVGMVFGKLLNMEHRTRFDEAGSFLTSTGFLYARAESGIEDTGQFNKPVYVLSGKSAACMIRRDAFIRAGKFDPAYEILGEETDLSWKVWLSGYKVAFVPSSVTYHAFNTRWKPMDFYTHARIYKNGCRNYLTMLTTNLERKNLIVPLTCQIIAWILSAIGMFVTGKFKAGWYILKGLVSYFFYIRVILRKRKQIQEKRTIPDSVLFLYAKKNPSISYFANRFLRYIKVGLHG